jgi:hypothetical protein
LTAKLVTGDWNNLALLSSLRFPGVKGYEYFSEQFIFSKLEVSAK